MSTHQARFDWKDFLKKVAVIAVPIAIQNLLTTCGSMVDTMMIAPLGEVTVGAVGLCAQFSSLLLSSCWGFVGGGMLFFAQYFGAKDHEGVSRSYGMMLAFIGAITLIFSALALLAPQLVMRMYTDKEVFHPIGIAYLSIIGFAYPLQLLSTSMSSLLRTTEQVRIPLIAAICSVLTNICLNWLLIQGHCGFPALGVRGAALATTLSALVNVLLLVILAKRAGHAYLLNVRAHFRWNRAAFAEFCVKCFPILCNEGAIGLGGMLINIVMGRQAETAISAYAVFRIFEGLIIGFFFGFSNSASVLVGAEVGAGHLDVAYQRGKRLVPVCSACIFAVCAAIVALHRPLLTAMSLSGESLETCLKMLILFGLIATTMRMPNWTMNDTYRSAGDSHFGSILEISFMLVLLVPLTYLAGIVLKLPFLVVFLCCYADEPIRFTLMVRHLLSGKWVRPVTDAGRQALPAFRAQMQKNKTTA